MSLVGGTPQKTAGCIVINIEDFGWQNLCVKNLRAESGKFIWFPKIKCSRVQ